MTYLILIIPILVLLAVASALFYAYKALPIEGFLLLVGALLLVPVITWKHYEQKFILQTVPDALEVHAVAYRNEKSWGFGPGGNEAGIRFYPLTEYVSRKVAAGGVTYFKEMPPNKDQQDRRWRGQYWGWRETPIQGDPWKTHPDTGLLNVTDYICAYGFCIDIPPDLLKQANEIVSRPRSFYAYGRIGMIVVSPEQRLVLYFYNG